MAKSSAGVVRTGGFALTLLSAAVVIELGVVAIAGVGFDEVSRASPFGRPGTTVAAIIIVAVALIGAVVAWRGAVDPFRGITAALVLAAGGVLAVMALSFLIAGGTPIIFAVLLAHATFSVAMIGRAVLQSTSSGTER